MLAVSDFGTKAQLLSNPPGGLRLDPFCFFWAEDYLPSGQLEWSKRSRP